MMQSPALDHGSPILEENGTIKWRDENSVYIQARKRRCHSVWCPSCSKLEWGKRAGGKLREFDPSRTREIVLTINPGLFENGKEAYDHVMEHKLLPGLIRNIERGKKIKVGKGWVWKYPPVKINKYMSFLEWHKNGLPHYHVMVETEKSGPASMIGGDMIRHYWLPGCWIKEKPIKSRKHWERKVGYLQKHGYFQEDKEHQTRLPDWAMNIPGLKIRRSNHSRGQEDEHSGSYEQDRDERESWIIDPETGEMLSPETVTYRQRLGFCGKSTLLNLYMGDKQVTGLFNLPYHQVRKDYPGQYRAGVGYCFRVSAQETDKLLSKMVRGEERRYLKTRWLKEREVIKHWCGVCGDWTYQKIREVRDDSDLYTCLRCKNIYEYKEREQEDWRSIGPGMTQKPLIKEHRLCPG
ncbi:hypothetical protein ES705_20843 [subsurface metagenome]